MGAVTMPWNFPFKVWAMAVSKQVKLMAPLALFPCPKEICLAVIESTGISKISTSSGLTKDSPLPWQIGLRCS